MNDKKNETLSVTETIISPAIRYTINIGDLQIVPAVAAPFTFSSETDLVKCGGFFYISFEHPF